VQDARDYKLQDKPGYSRTNEKMWRKIRTFGELQLLTKITHKDIIQLQQ